MLKHKRTAEFCIKSLFLIPECCTPGEDAMKPQLRLIICNERVVQNPENQLEELAMSRASEEVMGPLHETADMQKEVYKMLPILIGISLATVFGLMAHAVYGARGLPHEAWVYSVIWVLITAGVVVSLLQMPTACLVCRVMRRICRMGLADRVCEDCE
jgi:hypothetical protein